MFQCSYCNYESIYKYNVQRHEHVHNKNSTQNNIAPTTISVDSNVNNLLNQTQSGFGSVVTSSTHIPIEKHNEALDLIHKLKALWRNSKKEKIAYEKLQEEHRLVQEYRREDGEHTLAIITYLENVLNANNIRYNLELA